MENRIRVIIFDLDGTLYDTDAIDNQNVTAALFSLVEFLKISSDEAIDLLNERRQSANNSSEKRSISSTLNEIGVPITIVEKNQLKYINPEGAIAGDLELVNLIRQLKLSNKLCILTNTRAIIANRILKCIGFDTNDFDLVATGDKLAQAKPSKEAILWCIDKLNGVVSNSIFLGDRWNVDLKPAMEIGMQTVLVKGRSDVINWIKSQLHNQYC